VEVCALIDDTSVRFRDLAECARGLLAERARELVSSDERPMRTRFILSSMQPVCSMALFILAQATGVALFLKTGPWPPMAQWVAVLCLVALSVGIMAAVASVRAAAIRSGSGRRPQIPTWVGMTLLSCLFMMMVLAVASGSLRFSPMGSNLVWLLGLYQVFCWEAVNDLLSSLWSPSPLLPAFSAVRSLERNFKLSEQWVEGCIEMIAKGVPSPLAEAEAQLAERRRQLEEACAYLHSLSYSARFRRDSGSSVAALMDRF
jgi:hypothetical protein